MLTSSVLILAAGAGARMGGVAKCLLAFDGVTLIERLLRQLHALPTAFRQEVVLILGHHASEIQAHIAQLPRELRPLCVHNSQPLEDTASSLATGLSALKESVDAIAVLLADMPLISSVDIAVALSAFAARSPDHRVMAPRVHGVPGHPVLFDAHLGAELLTVGQGSLKTWCADNPQAVMEWEVANTHYTRDLDYPEDIARLERETGQVFGPLAERKAAGNRQYLCACHDQVGAVTTSPMAVDG